MILAACGVPPEMLRQSDGTGRREAWRQFLHASIAPVALGVAADLADKLDIPGLALNHERMMASDIAGKARAVQSLVKGGMDVAKAAALAGLMEPDETQPAPLGRDLTHHPVPIAVTGRGNGSARESEARPRAALHARHAGGFRSRA